MKKKLAFVIPSLDAGGGEKALVSLLNVIDFQRYDVDLVLFKNRGLFLNMLPKDVRVITPGGDYATFSLGLGKSLLRFLLQFKLSLFWHRLQFALTSKTNKHVARAEQHNWKHLSASMATIPGDYDAAIGFLEKSSVYFAVDKIKAKKKLGFIHTNYTDMGMDADFDRPYFQKLDAIVTVSDECENVLKKVFPEFADKISVLQNVVSPGMIRQLAENGSAPELVKTPAIVSVGRLHPLKGFDLAVEACAMLVSRGIPVQWFVIGDGGERIRLEKMIADRKLENHFYLIGLRENPYAYVRKAAIYVQPSRVEGKSIAIDEAKILAKPMVVTNYATVADQIRNGVNGLVSDISPEGIADGIQTLLNDTAMQRRFTENLSQESLGTEAEVEKFYRLIA